MELKLHWAFVKNEKEYFIQDNYIRGQDMQEKKEIEPNSQEINNAGIFKHWGKLVEMYRNMLGSDLVSVDRP